MGYVSSSCLRRIPYVARMVLLVIQPPSAFIEIKFSFVRSCMNERHEQVLGNRGRLAAMLKYSRGRPANKFLHSLCLKSSQLGKILYNFDV